MSHMEKYKKIREVGMELNHKIIESCLDHEILYSSAKFLVSLRVTYLFSIVRMKRVY